MHMRLLDESDVPTLSAVLRQCVADMGIFYSPYLTDPTALDGFYTQYQQPRSNYYVIEDDNGTVLGGGGYAPLTGAASICEIQKLYFSPLLQGKGYGKKLVRRLMAEAESVGFKGFYLETVPEMTGAIALYEKLGFVKTETRLGTSGHACCTVFMCRPANLLQKVA